MVLLSGPVADAVEKLQWIRRSLLLESRAQNSSRMRHSLHGSDSLRLTLTHGREIVEAATVSGREKPDFLHEQSHHLADQGQVKREARRVPNCPPGMKRVVESSVSNQNCCDESRFS